MGSCIVICEDNKIKYVLCGDECYYKACLEKKIPTGASVAPEKSKAFVEEYSKSEYITFLFHDPDILRGKIGFKMMCYSSELKISYEWKILCYS